MRPGCPWGTMKVTTAAYDVEAWMQSVEEDASKGEARKGDVVDCRLEQRNAHPQCTGCGRRWHQGQGGPQFPRDTSDGSPSSGGGSSH